jgi:hypothetical protein
MKKPDPSTFPWPAALFVRRFDLEKKYDRPLIGAVHLMPDSDGGMPGSDGAEKIVKAVGTQLADYVERRDFTVSAWWTRPEQAHRTLDVEALRWSLENGFATSLCLSAHSDMPWVGEFKGREGIREHKAWCAALKEHRVKVFLPPPAETPGFHADGNHRLWGRMS